MAVVATESVMEQRTELMLQLNGVLKQHPLGDMFTLMVSPSELHLAEDEVLVQVVDAETRVVELRPRKLSAVRPGGDVIHATQLVDPCDDPLLDYARRPQASSCHASARPDGGTGHVYVM